VTFIGLANTEWSLTPVVPKCVWLLIKTQSSDTGISIFEVCQVCKPLPYMAKYHWSKALMTWHLARTHCTVLIFHVCLQKYKLLKDRFKRLIEWNVLTCRKLITLIFSILNGGMEVKSENVWTPFWFSQLGKWLWLVPNG
jgi:hypothetical protein